MERNVGGVDRIVRAVVGTVLLAVAFVGFRNGRPALASLSTIAGIGLWFNALTCFCGGNYLLGIDTTGESCPVDER